VSHRFPTLRMASEWSADLGTAIMCAGKDIEWYIVAEGVNAVTAAVSRDG
jgi:hypothetical protein